MGAFSEYQECARLESAPICGRPHPHGSPVVQLTCGAASLFAPPPSAGRTAAPPLGSSLTLPDGRLNVGTHLPLLSQRYRYLSTVGEGVSAQVLLAQDTLRPGAVVTVKVLKRQYAAVGQREARTLRFLHSRAPSGGSGGGAPGIVRLLGTFMLGAHFCLVTERLHPRLLDWVAGQAVVGRQAALAALLKLAHQLLTSVAFLRRCGVVHADIKPDNVLMTRASEAGGVGVRLIDLGAAFSVTETDTRQVVVEVQTLPYRAPEVALALPYGPSLDEWSVGVVLAEAALSRPLFPCSTPVELLAQMAATLGPLPASLLQGSLLAQQFDLRALTLPQQQNQQQNQQQQHKGAPPLATLQGILGGVVQVPPPLSPLHQELQQVDPPLADLIMGLLRYDAQDRVPAQQALLHPVFLHLLPLPAVLSQGRGGEGGRPAGRPVPLPPAQPVTLQLGGLPAGRGGAVAQTRVGAEESHPVRARNDTTRQLEPALDAESAEPVNTARRREFTACDAGAHHQQAAGSAVGSGGAPSLAHVASVEARQDSGACEPPPAQQRPPKAPRSSLGKRHPPDRGAQAAPSGSQGDPPSKPSSLGPDVTKRRRERDRGGGGGASGEKPWWMV